MDPLAQYIQLYQAEAETLCDHSPELFNRLRPQALERLCHDRMPQLGDEKYPGISPSDMFAPDYGVNLRRVVFPVDASTTFRCGVPNVSTIMAFVVNDSFRPSSSLQRCLPQGVTVMSLAQAAQADPQGIGRRLGRLADETQAAVALNTLLLQDGVYIRVDRDVQCERPIQIVNIFNAIAPVMASRRILIDMAPGSKASVLVCDHSQTPDGHADVPYLANQVTEIYLDEGASLDFYEMEESSATTSRMAHLYATQATGSSLTVNGSTLMGGNTCNVYTVEIPGDNTQTRLAGMVTAADSQRVTSITDVRHHGRGGSSDQIFKYILDGESTGGFYGTITVDEGATHTSSNQTNRNLLASTSARMYTRPQLEIYCDEVKCSHGATTGQLDAQALFYMRSRGIPLAEARMMLMQAFMADVIDTVDIPALKTRLQQLIEARLSGRRTLCGECHI